MAKRTHSNAPEANFDTLLVLFRFFLSEIGVKDLTLMAKTLNSEEYEGIDPNGNSCFFNYIQGLPLLKIDKSLLRQYDENILRHLKHIGEKRGGIKLKYFQYLSLLFTEMYLDRYFSDREAFVERLNLYLHEKADETMGAVFFGDYTAGQLGKIAFMCATGSGKTLTMHINILQYLHYFKRAKRTDSSLSLNHILLVTPNEGMSQQHLDELELSNMAAKIFSKDGLFSSGNSTGEVLIIDINKFADKMGDKTVAVESFESNNLVLVDEAHRGLTSGDVWVGYRRKISENGFTFEYSATFKQSLNANAKKAEEREALEEYGKSIIMDYSYKYFYNDGYGKDYRIFNLDTTHGDESRDTYLVGCLLSFFQQMKFYHLHKPEMPKYNIEKPLLIFVGNRVTATTTESELSDVQEVLAFIDSFLRNKQRSITLIEKVLHKKTGLVNSSGGDLFEHGLSTLIDYIYKAHIPSGLEVYSDMLRLIFNSNTNSDAPRLHVENIKQVPGEIALKVGEYGDYFGVINIGDTTKLMNTLTAKGIVSKNEEYLNSSLFRAINNADSKVNILIGSRKFTEGWNSWRVSTVGLINFAKSEGSQAIQLFGRGVRLKGLNKSLKRSSKIEGTHLPHIGCVETLTVFGVKAQYMEMFKKMLEDEGAPTNEDFVDIKLPVISRYEQAKKHKLRVIRVKQDVDFKKQSQRLILDVPDKDFNSYLLRSVTRLDCLSKVQSIISKEILQMSLQTKPEEHPIPDKYIPLLDYQRIFDELIEYKNEKAYYNINIIKDRLIDILKHPGWYSLIIPANELELQSYSGLETLTDFAVMALKSYIDKFFRYNKEKWEAPHLEFAELEADDNNFIDTYNIRYTPTSPTDHNGELLQNFINDASQMLSQNGKLDEYVKSWKDALLLLDFRNHLYAPLVCLKAGHYQIQVSPVSLNEGEKSFVDYLKEFIEQNSERLSNKSLFLLRNKSKVGIGFFEAANFYPDYILWIDTPEKQYVTFVDPKGLLHIGPDNPKIKFFETIKQLEKRLQPTANGKTIVLNSFIMSSTSASQLYEWWHLERKDCEAMNVYTLDNPNCVSDMIKKILLS